MGGRGGRFGAIWFGIDGWPAIGAPGAADAHGGTGAPGGGGRAGGDTPGGKVGACGANGLGASIAGVFGASRSMLPRRTTNRMLPRRLASMIGSTPGSNRDDTTSSGPVAAKS